MNEESIKKLTVTNGENRTVKRPDIYEEFVLWSAMPPSERAKLGIETQEQFVEFYKIGINTPTAWKKRRDFENRVTELRREWGFSKTSAVIEGIYRAAIKGNPFSQKLWLQYFHNFNERVEVEQKPKVVISVNDIRFLIEGMPEPYKTKHYHFLRDLIDDGVQLKNKGLLEDTPIPAYPADLPLLSLEQYSQMLPISRPIIPAQHRVHRYISCSNSDLSIISKISNPQCSVTENF